MRNNKSRKIRVVILFGGKSAEHEVSVRSARNVFEALNKDKYDVNLVGISTTGVWIPLSQEALFLESKVSESKSASSIVPYAGDVFGQEWGKVDVAFPVLHGPMGEDGTIQGLLRLANVPFVGAGVLGSALGMDKDAAKRLLQAAGVPVAKFLVFWDYERKKIDFAKIKKSLGLPFFIKPANLGSSVGISKVKSQKDLKEALDKAFSYDRKLLIEEAIEGREIECSVLGNDKPVVSIPGEIIPSDEFYTYESKYLDENGARLVIPAKLDYQTIKKIQSMAIKTFKVLNCEGMARVDFFLKSNGSLYVNEINTIPGFTSISMYPKLWEASGISYSELIDKLISLALERFEKEEKLLVTRKLS